MKEYTGNSKVDFMAQIQLTGNVTPQIWYKTITRPNGKPYLLAIAILSDIAYWYRPIEIRDEGTGHIIGYRKRFKADILQRSYDQFAELFGETKRSITDAVVCLERLELIKRVFRTIEIGGMKYNNVLFIDFFPERLYELTYPEELCDRFYPEEPLADPVTEKRDRDHGDESTLPRNSGTGVTEKRDRSPEIPGEGSQNFGRRNTKNTTEITTENISSSSACTVSGCKEDDDIVIREYIAATDGVCPPEIVKEVIAELKKHDNMHAVSPPAFLDICRNITAHADIIANKSAYISKCVANMVEGQKLAKASAAYRIRADSRLRQSYNATDWDQFEQKILSN